MRQLARVPDCNATGHVLRSALCGRVEQIELQMLVMFQTMYRVFWTRPWLRTTSDAAIESARPRSSKTGRT